MKSIVKDDVEAFFQLQMQSWPQIRERYDTLKQSKVKMLKVGDANIRLQYNAGRITSTTAKIDAASLKERACFLCDENRPSEQMDIVWNSNYKLLVNPFPIFPKHLTIPCVQHTAQAISRRIGDMMALAQILEDYELFYNGPNCGASAPDHMHFQAGLKGYMPFVSDMENAAKQEVLKKDNAALCLVSGLERIAFVIDADDVKSGAEMFELLYRHLPISDGEYEPKINLLCQYDGNRWKIIVFPRSKHRPKCYWASGDEQILVSPASVDMGGLIALPREADFEKLKPEDITQIYKEVSISLRDAQTIVNRIVMSL